MTLISPVDPSVGRSLEAVTVLGALDSSSGGGLPVRLQGQPFGDYKGHARVLQTQVLVVKAEVSFKGPIFTGGVLNLSC